MFACMDVLAMSRMPAVSVSLVLIFTEPVSKLKDWKGLTRYVMSVNSSSLAQT